MWFIIARNRTTSVDPVIDRVKWRKAKASPSGEPVWDGDTEIVPVDRVVQAVRNGEEVGTQYYVNGSAVSGPRVIVGKFQNGSERIETEIDPQSVRRSLFELPEFDDDGS
jgi:hypothetical protein